MPTSHDRRNPYLVLGLHYGSSKSAVRKAFAKRSKEIKRGAFNEYRIEDLNWALHRLEQADIDPELDLEFYRAPANRALLHEHSHSEEPSGFFSPVPKPIERKTVELTNEEETQLIDNAVIAWLREILSSNGPRIMLPYPSLSSPGESDA